MFYVHTINIASNTVACVNANEKLHVTKAASGFANSLRMTENRRFPSQSTQDNYMRIK